MCLAQGQHGAACGDQTQDLWHRTPNPGRELKYPTFSGISSLWVLYIIGKNKHYRYCLVAKVVHLPNIVVVWYCTDTAQLVQDQGIGYFRQLDIKRVTCSQDMECIFFKPKLKMFFIKVLSHEVGASTANLI